MFMAPFKDLRISRKVVNRCLPNNEVFIYDTAVVNLGHFFPLNVKIGIIQKLTIFF
jgi:hypothetical protein